MSHPKAFIPWSGPERFHQRRDDALVLIDLNVQVAGKS